MDKKKKRLSYIVATAAALGAAAAVFLLGPNDKGEPEKDYFEIQYPTQNYNRELTNELRGIVLHHTALPTIERSLAVLTLPRNIVSTHCVVDTNGVRYVLCPPTTVAYHAGKSILNGREKCNEFTLGVEFQGNTQERPLTEHQIKSAVQYLVPIMRIYHISPDSVVTHAMVRDNYMKAYPERNAKDKVDITLTEYSRVMTALRAALEEER